MSIRKLFQTEDRAVSPVIGVILMVAITVILAAVIGAFVLGLGDDLGEGAGPSAQINFEDGSAAGEVQINHNGGDPLDLSEFTLVVNGNDTSNLPTGTLSGGEYETAATGTTGDTDIQLRHDPSGSVLGEGTVTIT